jgi:hypothetical protein
MPKIAQLFRFNNGRRKPFLTGLSTILLPVGARTIALRLRLWLASTPANALTPKRETAGKRDGTHRRSVASHKKGAATFVGGACKRTVRGRAARLLAIRRRCCQVSELSATVGVGVDKWFLQLTSSDLQEKVVIQLSVN